MKDSLGIEIVGGEVRYLLISGGRVTQADILSGMGLDVALARIKEEIGWDHAWVTIAFPEFHARRLPDKPNKETLKFYMKFQVGEEFQWQVRNNYIAFVPKRIVRSNHDLLTEAGIEPLGIEVSGLSAIRTFMENYTERRDENVVIGYLTQVANYFMFIKEGELIVGISRPADEGYPIITQTINLLGVKVFSTPNFSVFIGGDIEKGHELMEKLREGNNSIQTSWLEPFRKVKAISTEAEKTTKFIGALGVALREK